MRSNEGKTSSNKKPTVLKLNLYAKTAKSITFLAQAHDVNAKKDEGGGS